MLLAFALALAVAPTIHNSGFEAAALEGWTVQLPRDKARAAADPSEHRTGSHALLIEAFEPATASVSQTMWVRPGTLWRAAVWTKALPVANGGAIEITTPAGRVATSKAVPGGAWTELSVLFRVPSPGRFAVVLRNTPRNSTAAAGRVWFDDVHLEGVAEPSPDEIRIENKRLEGQISASQGGEFIEQLCHLIPSMIAQQVDGDSFEEEPPWKVTYKRESDKPHRPWYPDGAVQLASYSLDTDRPFNGKRSQRITLPVGGSRAGIAQDGFYFRKGTGYRLRLHMRGNAAVPVWASLRDQDGALTAPIALGRTDAAWQAAEANLQPSRNAHHATLAIHFEGPGTLWLDRITLIGNDAVLGLWRPDVVAKLKELKPGVIRFGGSSIESFVWDQNIGSWDERVPFTTYWGGLEPNFVGIEEFVQLCRHVDAEPLICVRWTGKSPEDAAAEVEYLNGSASTRWGALRARNGHREPYGVRYWQIGNEVGGPKYEASITAFAAAMRKVDPTILLLSAYPSAEILDRTGDALNFLCPHHYESMDLEGKRDEFEELARQIARKAARRYVRVAVTEWNTTAGEFGLSRGMLQTMGNAIGVARYRNLLHRYAGLVEIAIRSNLSDSFGSGVLVPGPGWLYVSPAYHAEALYARAAGSYGLKVERSSLLPWPLAEPDVSATVSADGSLLRIYAVNSTPQSLASHFRLIGHAVARSRAAVYVLADPAGDVEAIHSEWDRDAVAVQTRQAPLSNGALDFELAPYSVTLFEVALQAR